MDNAFRKTYLEVKRLIGFLRAWFFDMQLERLKRLSHQKQPFSVCSRCSDQLITPVRRQSGQALGTPGKQLILHGNLQPDRHFSCRGRQNVFLIATNGQNSCKYTCQYLEKNCVHNKFGVFRIFSYPCHFYTLFILTSIILCRKKKGHGH